MEKGGGSITHSRYTGASETSGYVEFGRDYRATEETGSARWLITPQLRPNEENHILQFSVCHGSSYEGLSSFSVLLSTNSSSVDDFNIELARYEVTSTSDDLPSSEYNPFSINLEEYKDQNIYIAFKIEDYGVTVWEVDEVGGLPLAVFANDMRAKMLSLAEADRYYFAGDEIRLQALVDNYGTQAMEDIELSFSVNGETEAAQSISLDAKEVSDTLSFSFTPQKAGSYQFSLALPDDDNNSNNKTSMNPVQVYSAGFFIEGFEGETFPPQYWYCDKSTTGYYTWYRYTGSDAFRGNAYVSSTTGYRLTTPLLQINQTDSLCFYAKTYSNSTYAILISKDSRIWDTVQVNETGTLANWTLQKVYFNLLSDSLCGNRYIAIVNTSGNMDVDEIFGPMLASRADQFSLVSLSPDPDMVNMAGQESRFQVIVYNDGTQESAKEITLFYESDSIASALTSSLKPGEYDTLSLPCMIDHTVSNGTFQATLPNDASVFDNSISLTAHIYEPGLWRFKDSFEDTEHPYWSFDDDNWTEKPSYNPPAPSEGSNYLSRYFTSQNTSIAVSPYMDLRYEEYEVNLDVYRNTAATDRPDKIELGFGSKPTWENVVFIDSINRLASAYPEGDEGWNTYTFRTNLSRFDSGFFLIRAISGLNESGSVSYQRMHIDNLSIRPVLAKDAEASAIVSPTDTVWGADSIKTILITRLLNYGEESLTTATLHYGYGDAEIGTYEWKGHLAAGADTALLLTPDLKMPYLDTMPVWIEAEAEGDGNPLNNHIEKMLVVKPAYTLPFVANFEDSSWDKDWQNFTFDTCHGDNWIH